LNRKDLLACAALVVLATLAFGDVFIGINNFYMRDLTRYYYPTKQILREVVFNGEFPYWNRFFSAGQPIAANPEHEVFYPLTWLILLPSYDFGYRLLILLHIYIGLVGMYALLRSMELRIEAALFGAVAWGLGGLYLSYINLLPILFCAAWLPLVCLFVRRFLLRPNKRDFALGALFFGLQFLVGEPTTIVQSGLLLGMYALYRAWYARPRITKAITRLVWIGLISIAGLLIGAAQVLPAIDHVRDSARSRPFGFDLVSAWSMPWAKFAELLYPNILGHMSINRVTWYWGGGLYTGMGSPFLFSAYCGILVIALAVGGAFIRPRGGRFVLIVALVSALLALGGHTPLLKGLYAAGIATSIRYPEKFMMMGIFAVIIFAAQMFERVLDGDEELRDGALGFSLAAFTVALIVAIVGFTPLFATAMTKIWVLTPGANANYIVKTSARDWIYAALRCGGAVALLATVRLRRGAQALPPVGNGGQAPSPVGTGRSAAPPLAWLIAAAIFVCADLLPIGEELNPRMPRRFFDPPPIAATLPKNRADYRVFHEADWYGQEEIARKYFSTGSSVYWVVRNGLFPMTPAGSRVRTVLERDYDKTALLTTIDLTDSVWDVKRSGRADWYVPFMAMSNAWYRGEYRDFENEKKWTHNDFTKSLPVKFTPGPHYPRYYFADQIVTIRNREDFVKHLTTGTYNPRVAFITQPAFAPGNGVVRGVRETANHATIDVDSDGEAFLVMSVTPHKYWRITIDGAPLSAIVTNIAYQGVIVTPGHHRIEMDYANPLVQIGGGISAIAALLLIVLAILRPRLRGTPVSIPAYEEAVHVVVDAEGTHLEPAEPVV
jgi:hypothetical protein